MVKFRKNFGQTAALKAGFDHSEGNIAISMDGDLQNDPTDIPKLIEKIEKEDYDVVCGWRADRKDLFSKKITSKFANLLRKMTTGSKIHDSGCTFRAYRNGCVKNLDLYGETHRYIPAMLSWKGYRLLSLSCAARTDHAHPRKPAPILSKFRHAFWPKF